ncbi:MAG: extracellular solute-binding protein [Candidatus Moranbacteria bacterium]|nr:extracellular solute-binding protein [Candidatus Moranbacteria bacterium]
MAKKTKIILYLSFFLILFVCGCGLKQKPPAEVEPIEIWGIWDDSDLMKEFIHEYERQNPQISKISYRKFTPEEYEEELIKAFANQQGPDIFLAHHTWTQKNLNLMISLQEAQTIYNNTIDNMGGCSKPPKIEEPLISQRQYKEAFSSVVYKDFVKNGQIYGIPLAVDTLALYYNQDLFNEQAIAYAPNTWEDLEKVSRLMTKKDEFGNINQSGISLGTSRNVNRAGDILIMLMMQKGNEIVDFDKLRSNINSKVKQPNGNLENVGVEAMEFYSSFADATDPNYTWNSRMHNSIDLFQEGRLAMMINYTFALETIRAKSPRLNFSVAEIPQFKNSPPENRITYPNYWGYVVSRSSAMVRNKPLEAWKFLKYLGQKEQSLKYTQATQRPGARKDVIEIQKNDPEIGIFAQQVLKAKSWFQPNEKKIDNILNNNIQDVALNRKTPEQAVEEIDTKIQILLNEMKN